VLRTALRTEARRRRPHILIACVVLGLALSPAGATAVAGCALGAAIAAAWAFGGSARGLAGSARGFAGNAH
jgi:hypothetical protein